MLPAYVGGVKWGGVGGNWNGGRPLKLRWLEPGIGEGSELGEMGGGKIGLTPRKLFDVAGVRVEGAKWAERREDE